MSTNRNHSNRFLTSFEVILNKSTRTGSVRREVRGGREYLVVPATLIVPGVLNGSRGPLYYPPDEVARNADDWNDVPIVVRHPTKNGIHVSGRSPDVLDRYKVGRVYGAHVDNKGRLRGEGWFDVEATKRVDRRVYDSLSAGLPVELSTGLFTENEKAGRGANHLGREYDYIARNYKPDHLAVLPDEVGACSVNDGCGFLVNSVPPEADRLDWEVVNAYDTEAVVLAAEELSHGGVMPGYGQVFTNPDKGLLWYVGGDGDERGFGDKVKDTLGGLDGVNGVVYEAESFPPKDEGWVQVFPKHREWVTSPTEPEPDPDVEENAYEENAEGPEPLRLSDSVNVVWEKESGSQSCTCNS